MEVTKRTYQKHKTEKKITVKHYLNTSIKEYDEIGDEIYPVYVQVTYKRKNTKFKSKIPNWYDDTLPLTVIFDNFNAYEEYFNSKPEENFERALTRDLNLIKWLVNACIEANPNSFDISELPKIYHQQTYELTHFVDWCLKREIQDALYEIKGLNNTDINIFLRAYLGRIDMSSPALHNLEYFSIKYPELINVKKLYNSGIWFLTIHIGLDDTSIFSVVDYSDGRIIYFPPTIFDYLTNTFQKNFINSFKEEPFAQDIISDLDKLYSKYYYKYFVSQTKLFNTSNKA